MTLAAHFIDDGSMNRIPEDPPAVGTVGIMTGTAFGLCHWIPQVLSSKGRPIRLMAIGAEAWHVALQEKRGFSRGMRIVTIQTSFFYRIMLESVSCDGPGNILVAAETEFVPALQQVVLILGGVGIMALHAISLHRDFMSALRLFGDDAAVA
jgi:hypothetical protein